MLGIPPVRHVSKRSQEISCGMLLMKNQRCRPWYSTSQPSLLKRRSSFETPNIWGSSLGPTKLRTSAKKAGGRRNVLSTMFCFQRYLNQSRWRCQTEESSTGAPPVSGLTRAFPCITLGLRGCLITGLKCAPFASGNFRALNESITVAFAETFSVQHAPRKE